MHKSQKNQSNKVSDAQLEQFAKKLRRKIFDYFQSKNMKMPLTTPKEIVEIAFKTMMETYDHGFEVGDRYGYNRGVKDGEAKAESQHCLASNWNN